MSERGPLRVIEVSRRPVYDAALAISVVVLTGNGLWFREETWVVTRRVLLSTLTAVIVNAFIDVSIDQRLRRRLTAGDPHEAAPRVIGVRARLGVMALALVAIFGASWFIPGDPPFSLALALATVSLTLLLGVAEWGVARRLSGEERDLEPPSMGDVVLAAVLLGLCALDVSLGFSPGSSTVRVFALVVICAVVLVARSVDATLRQRRAMIAGFERANKKLHEAMRVKANNWGAADDSARDATWATQTLLAALDLRAGQTVADIGAGAGYFTRKLCERVGASGRVYATDRDPWAVSRLRELGEREGFTWLRTMHVDDAVPLPVSERLDRALLANVGLFALHREREGRAHLQDLAAKIFPGGLLVVFQEFVHAAGWTREAGAPPHPEDDCDADALLAWAEAHFELIARPTLPAPAKPYQPLEQEGYLLVLRRR